MSKSFLPAGNSEEVAFVFDDSAGISANHRIESWNHGIMELWNPEIVKFLNFSS